MSATRSFEILGLFDQAEDCHKLLHAPVARGWTFRETEVYEVVYDGNEEALEAFVGRVLLDPISQEMRDGIHPKFEQAAFVLEYGMKGGALDLEKETILNYYRSLEEPGFDLQQLTLRRRIYGFGEGAEAAPFVRDVCNPAIHSWRVLDPAA